MRALLLSALIIAAVRSECWAEGPSTELPFEAAAPNYAWSFPRDHGAHSGFQTEWWYYTGQLYEAGKEPFRDKPSYGFQLTFFRRGDRLGSAATSITQRYLAHAALTDIKSGTCSFASRRSGGELGIAGATETTLRAWTGSWSAEFIDDLHLLRFDLPNTTAQQVIRLSARTDEAPLLQGTNGYSKKGRCPECASMYYSIPSLSLSGYVESDEKLTPLHGKGWMDHEFMSNALDREQVGWDWMGLMFRDGTRLTLFSLRKDDGSSDFISGSLSSDGQIVELSQDQFSMEAVSFWKSELSGATYPTAWRITIPSRAIDITVRARVEGCELREEGSPVYWEGPVASSDESVIGYLEMTGYAGKIKM